MTDSFQSYLEAKRPVDDRALNNRVWDTFLSQLEALATQRTEPLRLLEIGGGIGSMVARLGASGAFPSAVEYHLVDLNPASIAYARSHLPRWLEQAGYRLSSREPALVAHKEGTTLRVELTAGDAFERDATADAVIGAAVFDLLERERALEFVSRVLTPGGCLYAPLTFDGVTAFSPTDPADTKIEALYHRHMDEIRDEPGGSRAGRKLLSELETAHDVLAVSGSEWVLRPHERDGSLAHDERTVSRFLLETMADALTAYPEETLADAEQTRWLERRNRELEAGELTMLIHHLDICARF